MRKPAAKTPAAPAAARRTNFLALAGVLFVAIVAGGFVTWKVEGTIGFLDRYPILMKFQRHKPSLDKAGYDARMIRLANYPELRKASSSTATSTRKGATASTTAVLTPRIGTSTSATLPGKLWPAAGTVYPNAGALLPFSRIVAYYGNFYSKGMGVLGQYPPDEVVTKLKAESAKWLAADPTTPVIPAIDYIAVTAQGSAGADGKYRLRMPDDQIQKAIDLAKQVNGIVILEVQAGLSEQQIEIPLLEKYLKLPQVHLAIDPEFSMKTSGAKPGHVIGTEDAATINFAAQYLANLVRTNNLPPKILIVHRFTDAMVTHAEKIKPLPEVEVVMDMDGWGPVSRKLSTYQSVVYSDPVQFAGIKLFYKNDLLPPSTGLMTTDQVMNLIPRPSYIQYQ